LTRKNAVDLNKTAVVSKFYCGKGNCKIDKHHLYSSPNIVRVIKSRRMKWAGHVARMGEGRGVYRVLVGGPKARDHREDLGVGERITLRWTSWR
jgi:hypothetical protein